MITRLQTASGTNRRIDFRGPNAVIHIMHYDHIRGSKDSKPTDNIKQDDFALEEEIPSEPAMAIAIMAIIL